jgi:hypothetical protein
MIKTTRILNDQLMIFLIVLIFSSDYKDNYALSTPAIAIFQGGVIN